MSAATRTPAASEHSGRRRGRAGRPQDRQRPLRHEEKVELALLAMPTFALALAITIVSTQLGEVTRHYTHQTTVIGAIIGGEGVMALWVPLIFGSWSDTLRTRIGGRLPFVLAGGLPAAAVLALIGVVHGLGLVALVTALFFCFYFVAYEPYRAMYPDMLPSDEVGGRAQSAQAVARGIGTGFALLGGGLLLSVGRPLPFVVAAVVMIASVDNDSSQCGGHRLPHPVFNLVIPALVALALRPRVKPLLTAAEEGRVPARAERRRAAAPLAGIGPNP